MDDEVNLKEFAEALKSITPAQKESCQWVEENLSNLKEYRNQWLVLYRKEVLAHSPDYDQANKAALEKFEGDPKDLLSYYLQDIWQNVLY